MSETTAIPAPETRIAISFVGDALGPFFLEDPEKGKAAASFKGFRALDAAEAADEWPFGERALVREGLENMTRGLADGITDELTWEYRRLFVGPGHKAAAPWGSVYTDRDGVIFGESALDLAAWMRANGIARRASDGDPEDHIGLLLLMMAWISRHHPELLAELLRDHILTWAPGYLEQLERVAEHPFYIGLAQLTRASLEGMNL